MITFSLSAYGAMDRSVALTCAAHRPHALEVVTKYRAVHAGANLVMTATVDAEHVPVLSEVPLRWCYIKGVPQTTTLVGDDALSLLCMLHSFDHELWPQQDPEPEVPVDPTLTTADDMVREWMALHEMQLEASRMYQRRDYKLRREPQAIAAYESHVERMLTRKAALLEATRQYIKENDRE